MSDRNINTLISIWSRRPPPLSTHGKAWEDGARQGWEWAQADIADLSRRLAEAGREIERLRAALEEIADDPTGLSIGQVEIAKEALAGTYKPFDPADITTTPPPGSAAP